MKEEFNYFCLFDAFPSPSSLKTWAEQLRDGEHNVTTLSPLTSIDGVGVAETEQLWNTSCGTQHFLTTGNTSLASASAHWWAGGW